MIVLPVLFALLLLGTILIVRGLSFVPPEPPAAPKEDIPVDSALAVSHLQAAIRCRTISTPELRDEAEFEKFRSLLPRFYPLLFHRAQLEPVDATGILIRLPGRSSRDPVIFLGHYDVVPVQADQWEKPPFDGILENGVLWGRGTLDMKNQLICMLEAIELLLSQGFTPEGDIYFCLSGEEEIMGSSAQTMKNLLTARGVHPRFVLDEGGDIIDNFFPGANVPCAMIGIGEKGAANLKFVARGAGGHSSVPNHTNPLPKLCKAMDKLEKHPFPLRPGSALEGMVDTMGRYCSFPLRVLFANRRLLRPLYYRWIRRQGGMIEAASRTTFALTQASGSAAGNVIPTEATMFANLRLMAGDTTDQVISRLRRIMGDPDIAIQPQAGAEPQPDSLCTQGFREIQAAIEATWPEAVVSPYLMVACTDSRHWRDVCDNVYRFSAKHVTGEEKATVHGNNERIHVENTENAVKFFYRLMRNL